MKTPTADNIVTLVTPEYQQDELAKRRRSLEAKRMALRRQFEELEADEALAKDEPLWNKRVGSVTTTDTVRRLTREAVERLDPVPPLFARWQDVQFKFAKLPADEDRDARLYDEGSAVELAMITTAACTLRGITAKMLVLRHMFDMGEATDERDERLMDSIIADLGRMLYA
jgi:hypothetical protein